MNKKVSSNIRLKMFLSTILFGYSLGTTFLLIVLYVRGNHWKKLYQQALLDSYSLERVRLFFQRLQPLLKMLYPLIDRLNKSMGRPATDRRFQLRFLFLWKFFLPIAPATAIDKFNKSPEMRQILEAPETDYTRWSLRRFLESVGEEGFIKMGLLIITDLVKKGVLDLSQILLDSFPIYSFLNTVKCLRMPKFDLEVAQEFYQHLSLAHIIKLFPKQHWKAAPLTDKIKAWIHHYLWDAPSVEKNHQLIFGQKKRMDFMGLEKGWKTAQTYRLFLEYVKQLKNYSEIEKTLITEVSRVLNLLAILPPKQQISSIDDLCSVFHQPPRLKDMGITLNYCSAKDQTFIGRGGLICGTTSLEIPLFLRVTSRYKLNEKGIITFLKELYSHFGELLKNSEIYGDAEFGTKAIKEVIEVILSAITLFERYGNSSDKSVLTPKQKTTRKTIERIIARLATYFQIEHPRFLGDELVPIHTQLYSLCDLLLVSYNIITGNTAHPHAIKHIRG